MWRFAFVLWLLVGFGVNGGRRWHMWIRTSDVANAGTNAKVFIILFGPNGEKSPPKLLENIFLDDHEQNSLDHFIVDIKTNIEDVCYIRIYHDNSGDSPAWNLKKVFIRGVGFTNSRVFICNCWVPTEQEVRKSNFVIERWPPCSAGRLP